MFGCGLCGRVREVLDLIDAVEVCNAQNAWSWPNHRRNASRTRTDFLGWSGWTLHHGDNLDACYQVLDPFDGPAGFLRSVRRAHLARGRHDLSYFLRTALYVVLDRSPIGLPETFGPTRRAAGRSGGCPAFPAARA